MRPVGPDAERLAVAVYAEPGAGGGWRTPPATDQGFEGVACVDDAARAAIVFARMQPAGGAHGTPPAEVVRGLLAFVTSMQVDDGRFVNFIADWDGTRNRTGPTSVPGGPWSARAVHALAIGARMGLGDALLDAARRGLDATDIEDPNLDVHAVSALASLELWRFTGARADADRCLDLCEAILTGCVEDVLRDCRADPSPHLWGHLQEAALAEVGAALGAPSLVSAAQRSADLFLIPALTRIATRDTQAFEASCLSVGLSAVRRASGDVRYAVAVHRAREWFLGRNAAGAPVYDAASGAVSDGVDDGRVSRNAGAEASVEGANALLGAVAVPGPGVRDARPRRLAAGRYV